MWGAGQDAGSEACQEGFNEEVTFEFGTEGGNWGAVGEGTGQGLGRGHRLCKGPGAGLCGWSRVSDGGEREEQKAREGPGSFTPREKGALEGCGQCGAGPDSEQGGA